MTDQQLDDGSGSRIETEERRRTHTRRSKAFEIERGDPEGELKDVVGLALSGGGLRSALFNDGFLQAISHRGLLRYIDYVCSVSGGGYIAGHLMTYSRPADFEREEQDPGDSMDTALEEPSFHHDESQWRLGRDPKTGLEDPSHLPSIGGYLSQSGKFAGGYLLNQLPVFMFHLASFGVLGTLTAILYRWLDAPVFRDVYQNALGIRTGGECLIAFLPAILLGSAIIVVFGTLKLVAHWRGARSSGTWDALPLYSVLLVGLATIAGFAVFVGNDLTSAGGNQGNWHLNSFATYVAIATGVIQIIVFLGRDKLFKSERQDSPHWKKVIQALASHGVLLFFVFSIVHLMARENISKFTETRDPYLQRGEVTDWAALSTVFAQCTNDCESSHLHQLDYVRWCRAEIRGSSAYAEAVKQRTLEPMVLGRGEMELDPESPAPVAEPISESYWSQFRWLASSLFASDRPQWSPAKERIKTQSPVRAALQFHANQAKFLEDHAPVMESERLTDFLLLRPTAPGRSGSSWSRLLESKTVGPAIAKLPSARKGRLETSLNLHDLGMLPSSEIQLVENSAGWPRWERKPRESPAKSSDQIVAARVRLNRDLLEVTYGSVLKPFHVASTPVVQPYDQRARWRWLGGWLAILLCSLLLTKDINRHGYLFEYYRRAISDRFLVRSMSDPSLSAKHVNGETRMDSLRPEQSGLPMPIYLTTWLKPETRYGSLVSRPRGAAFTPNGLTLYDDPDKTAPDASEAPSTFTSWKRYDPLGQGKHLKLGDVIATSGAAITPFSSSNFSLAAMMDFLGARLGMWVRHPQRKARRSSPAIWAAACLALMSLVSMTWFGPWSLLPWLGFSVMTVVAFQLRRQTGYPQVVASYLGQLLTATVSGGDGRENWPNIFLADGGFHDYLGVTELIRRRCDLIVVSDAGCNTGSTTLESLARMCEQASSDYGVRFVNLDHDAPIDFQRLNRDEKQNVAQPYLLIRVIYPTVPGQPIKSGLLLYAQMAISSNDPIEIQQIRSRFPSFPDEPTTNQFYTAEQVAAYRRLGYHVGSRICSQLCRWNDFSAAHEKPEDGRGTMRQPYFDELVFRIRRAYIQMCFEEYYFRENDVYGESVWRGSQRDTHHYPSWTEEHKALMSLAKQDLPARTICEYWLERFRSNADVFSVYLDSVNREINRLELEGMVEASATPERSGDNETEQVDESAGPPAFPSENAFGAPPSLARSQMFGTTPMSLFQGDLDASMAKLVPAHFVVVAAACQQLHEGVPSAIFQIGGREKLVSLIVSMCASLEDADSDLPIEVADSIIHEINELNECVFQSASLVAVVSFVQCLVRELALKDSPHPIGPADVEQSSDAFDLLLDFRQLMKEAILCGYPSRIRDLIQRYLNALVGGQCSFDPPNKVALGRDLQNSVSSTKTPRTPH